ncbi:cyclin-a2-4 [Anaeramoeba flamelloides]|uniref:Cyclin-a2-4 n=1 Tax=Anaeramoeba flamelloides TaxID=1746091 RepID=A0ABQ8YIU4_9EUKA|nr:cyclin-a2-4 [Anaeramoeba flamelloides]
MTLACPPNCEITSFDSQMKKTGEKLNFSRRRKREYILQDSTNKIHSNQVNDTQKPINKKRKILSKKNKRYKLKFPDIKKKVSKPISNDPKIYYESIDSQSKENLPKGVDNLNNDYFGTPHYLNGYSSEIYENLRTREEKHRPKSDYMVSRQREINQEMREILIDWLCDFVMGIELRTDTLFLAINYMDRFLGVKNVRKKHLQLVGVTCLWIASKYEEIEPPSIEDFVFITKGSCSASQIRKCEIIVLTTLRFSLTVTTPMPLLRWYLRATKANKQLIYLANYLCELQLHKYHFLNYSPSKIAAGAVAVAQLILQPHLKFESIWCKNLQYYTRYSFPDLCTCGKQLLNLYKMAPKSNYRTVYKKYAKKKGLRVSMISLPENFKFD